MNKIRPFILAVAVILAGFMAYGLFTLPSPKGIEEEGFSAERVVKDIEVISKEHHSVANPEERAKVREYLVQRLEGLGADTVLRFEYDSLVSPSNRPFIYTFDAVDLLAEFPPLNPSQDDTYLMFVAHYDSRCAEIMPKDTVWSYGAADDGYGIGVTLETLSQLLKERGEWHQGVKVLFTDAEEVGMQGMKSIWEHDREVFDNVGFVINIEARGPWGPVLLFEACPGNEKVVDLYASAAKYPFTYSLTTVVYKFMPNYTDFKVIKDSIPGLNFSTIVDVNHYHTDLDNFSNVSPKSIQHYGAQILPIAQKYLTDSSYSDMNSLKAEADATNFTIPLLGLFNFSKVGYVIFNVIIFLLFLLVFSLDGVRGRMRASKIFKISVSILGLSIAALAAGELVAYLCSSVAGAKFKPFGVITGIRFDNIAMLICTVVLLALTLLGYIILRGHAVRNTAGSMRANASVAAASKFACTTLYGALALMFFLSAVLLIALGENLMFLVPLCFATGGMIMWRLSGCKFMLVVAIFMILLHALSFLYALAMALTIGAYGAIAMLAFCDFMVLIPLADLYLSTSRKK